MIDQVRIIEPNTNLKLPILTANPNNTPSEVATPFPPLNPRKTVQLWPIIQLNPKITRKASPERLGIRQISKSAKSVAVT